MPPANTRSGLAIVIGGYVNGLGLVRSLAALGHRVVVITTQPFDIAQHSRHVSEHHHLQSPGRSPGSLAALLEARAREWAGAVVFPTTDQAIEALDLHRERLAPWFRLVIPAPDCVPYLLDRVRMRAAARDVGIPLPHSHGPAAESDSEALGIRYPLVVKPVRSDQFSATFGKKLFVVRNPAELEAVVRRLSQARLEGELFDVVPGPDSNILVHCAYMDRHGRPMAECTIRKLRQSPPGFGVARVAEMTGSRTMLREQSIELLRRIGLRGFAAVEFKLDERDGTFRFIEVNGRSVIYNRLLRQGNLDIARLATSDYGEGRVSPMPPNLWQGVWIHLHADVLRSLQNWRREGLSARNYLAPYRRERIFAVWSRIDPGPFRAQWTRTLRQAMNWSQRGPGGNWKTDVA